ncbi:MAG: Gfo/Idh/MocA family oxidoreductase [Candidatus Lernaella stagnicola]|nr:Gfo/Idh/MocA family oxidoreductase [Candidatus Lernaella stagnicola]
MAKHAPISMVLVGAGARGELNLGTLVRRHGDVMAITGVAEADDDRRETVMRRYNIAPEKAVGDWRDLAGGKPLANAAINALPCRMHYESTLALLQAGYDVFLEKPMALTPAHAVHLTTEAERLGRVLVVSLQSRHNKIYSQMRRHFDNGDVGRLMSIDCAENVGYWHFIMSYVRGIHHRASDSHSFVMAKGVHDLDLVAWFAGAPAKKVASFGKLSYFNADNAPEGAPEKCLDGCPVFDTCLFNAYKQFVDPGRPDFPWRLLTGMSPQAAWDVIREPRFRTLASVISHDVSREKVTQNLRDTTNGACVFRADNDVVDHQTVSIEFANEVTASFQLNGFSLMWERSLNLHGTAGELRSADFSGKLELRTYQPGRLRRKNIPYHGIIHGGGDEMILLEFARAVREQNGEDILTSAKNCLEAHMICFAAEEARLREKVVDMDDFRRRAEREAATLP